MSVWTVCFGYIVWGPGWRSPAQRGQTGGKSRNWGMWIVPAMYLSVAVGSCPCSPGNNAAVWVMEGPVQPLSPPHSAAQSWEHTGEGDRPLGLLLGYFSVLCFTNGPNIISAWEFKHKSLVIYNFFIWINCHQQFSLMTVILTSWKLSHLLL